MTNMIGPAGALARTLIPQLGTQTGAVKLLFCGPPGVGKTTLANEIAAALCGNAFSVESANGRDVSVHVLREWRADMASSSLFGTGWKVKIVNEVDTMPRDAQDLVLSFLDEMPGERAFIGTSNLDVHELTERFRTRLQRYDIGAPDDHELIALLSERVPLPIAEQFAVLAGGNVRAAILDADAWMRTNPKTKCTAASQFNLLFA